MIQNADTALKVAEFLLQIKAIQLNPDDPFTWASGWKSPIYCDNRKTLSYPNVRTFIRQCFVDHIQSLYGKPDVIAGVATGGIAHGALVAHDMGLPFIYVRSSVKEHGLQNQVEGVLEEGQSVVVIEDLISTGGSSLSAVKAISERGGNVKGMGAIFSYDLEISHQNFKDVECQLFTLCDYNILIDQALRENYITENHMASLHQWRQDPSTWKQ